MLKLIIATIESSNSTVTVVTEVTLVSVVTLVTVVTEVTVVSLLRVVILLTLLTVVSLWCPNYLLQALCLLTRLAHHLTVQCSVWER